LSVEFYKASFSKFANCKYFDENVVILNGVSSNSLILLHLNIRSLHKHFDALTTRVHKLTLICFTETRIKDQPLINISLSGYNLVHANSNSSAGGVAAYVSNQLIFETCKKQ